MVRKFLLIIFLISLFVIPSIFAVTTPITVKTNPYNKVLPSVFKSGTTERISINFGGYKSTNLSGKIDYLITTSDSKFDIKFDVIKDDGTHILSHTFNDLNAGVPYLAVLYKDNESISQIQESATSENISDIPASQNITENATSQNTSTTSQNSPQDTVQSAGVTSNAVSNESNITKSFSPLSFFKNNSKVLINILIVILVIIVIAVILIFFIYIKNNYMKKPSYSVTFRHREKLVDNKNLADAEKKLRAAQEEIEKIKNKEHLIRDAEKKLEEDRIRLQRLRRGEF